MESLVLSESQIICDKNKTTLKEITIDESKFSLDDR